MDAQERARKIGEAAQDAFMNTRMVNGTAWNVVGLAAARCAYELDGVNDLLRRLSILDNEYHDSADYWIEHRIVMEAASRVREAMGNTTPRDGGETGWET